MAALAEDSGVRLTVLAPPYVHPVYEGLPGVGLSPVDPRIHRPLQAWGVGRAIAGDDEVAVVLPDSLSSALVVKLAGIPRRIGRATSRRAALFTETLPPYPKVPVPILPGEAERLGDRYHRWRRYAELVERLLGRPVAERYPLHVPAVAAEHAARLLAEPAGTGPVIGLNPAANGPARRWPAARFEALGCGLREALDARVVVLGGRRDVELGRAVAAAIPGAASLAGRMDLKSLMAVLAGLDLLVTNDTGPMHLAAALGTPLLDLCGAADERVTGPRSPRARVLRDYLFCSPCVRNTCPFDLECMDALSVSRVVGSALEWLGRTRAAPSRA